MSAIPLIKVRYAEAFVAALDRLGAPTEPLLHKCHLNADLIRVREGLMPVSQLWDFAAFSTLTVGVGWAKPANQPDKSSVWIAGLRVILTL